MEKFIQSLIHVLFVFLHDLLHYIVITVAVHITLTRNKKAYTIPCNRATSINTIKYKGKKHNLKSFILILTPYHNNDYIRIIKFAQRVHRSIKPFSQGKIAWSIHTLHISAIIIISIITRRMIVLVAFQYPVINLKRFYFQTTYDIKMVFISC